MHIIIMDSYTVVRTYMYIIGMKYKISCIHVHTYAYEYSVQVYLLGCVTYLDLYLLYYMCKLHGHLIIVHNDLAFDHSYALLQ